MIDILKYIFSDFWVWLGFTILFLGGLNGLAEIITALRKKP